ncbi:MAG: hypothetical protein IPM23_19685 [Candidatus Melainabacteria bacterium]|nr:hypothetical protein [Candidatus Melainabacteria bacterium]
MKSCVILVDNSNLFIEGMKFSAWDKGLVGGHDIEPTDTTWRLDFETLLEYLAEEAKRKGWQVELCSFSSAFNPRGKLAAAVDRVRLLDESFDLIGRYAISKVSQ